MKIMTILMNTKRATDRALLAVAVFTVAPIFVAVAADSDYTAATGYVTMKGNDNNSIVSFNAAGNWSDGAAPHNTTNYYVGSSRTLCTTSAQATFQGNELVVAGQVYHKASSAITWGNTVFLPGSSYRILSPGWIQSAESTHWIVQGIRDSPFRLYSDRSGDDTFRVYSPLVSDANGYMTIENTGNPQGRKIFTFRTGTPWANYAGTASIGTNCQIRADSSESLVTSTPGTLIVRSGGGYELLYRNKAPEVGHLVVESGGELSVQRLTEGSYFNITRQLELADGARIVSSNSFAVSPNVITSDVFRLSTAAVAAGIPNLDKILYLQPNGTSIGRLPRFFPVVHDDDEVVGGKWIGWRKAPVITMNKQNYGIHVALKPASGETAADYWSDGELPHDGADYLISKTFFITGKGYPYTFPGDSCTVQDGVQFGLYANMRSLTFNDLSFIDGVIVRPLNDATYHLSGKLSLLKGAANKPALVNCANYPDQSLTIYSEIDGDNDIVFRRFGETLSTERAEVTLTGMNTNYTGRIIVNAAADENAGASMSSTLDAANTLTLHITDARNLGGALSAFDADSLVVSNKCRLAVDAATTFSETTRGWHFPADAYLRINSGVTATCANTLTVGGELVKEGTGTLRLSARPVVENASARLTVSAGDLAVSATDALNGLPVALASGSFLVIDREAGDAAFKEKGLNLAGVSISSADAKVPVRFTFDAESLDAAQQCHSFPVMTYPSTQSAAVVSTYEFKKPDEVKGMGYALEMVERDNGDGTVTLDVRLVRKGTRIILR